MILSSSLREAVTKALEYEIESKKLNKELQDLHFILRLYKQEFEGKIPEYLITLEKNLLQK